MKKKTINRIKSMIHPYIKVVIFVTILALILDGIALLKPYLVRIVINEFMSKGLYENGVISILTISSIYIGLVLFENVLNFFNENKTNQLGEKIVFDLRNKLFKYMENANIKFHDKVPSGKLFVRIMNDTEDVYTLFSDVITTFAKDIIILIGIIGVMIYLSYKLALVSFIVIPLIIVSAVIITKLLNKTYAKTKIIRTKLNTFFAESIYGVKLIKIFNRHKEKQRECEEVTAEFRDASKPLGQLQGLLPALMTIIENIGISAIVCAVIYKIIGTSLDVGLIYMFITYLKDMFDPINRIIENVDTVEEAVTSIDKIYEILEQPEFLEDFENGHKLQDIKGKIEFKNVWFAYEYDNWILKDVTFTIEPGQSIALVRKDRFR